MICTDFQIVKSEGYWVVDFHDRSGELMVQHLKKKKVPLASKKPEVV